MGFHWKIRQLNNINNYSPYFKPGKSPHFPEKNGAINFLKGPLGYRVNSARHPNFQMSCPGTVMSTLA